ncbi:hypothetical protein DVS77_03770 [Mycolicibacterium moriokaense]|nr:hypothetical protein DVS77_03770 [Mycolicibacterium moriokaense]
MRGIAIKAASTPCKAPVTDADEPPIDADERSQPHPAAFAGAVLALVLIGLLVFAVVKVSGDSVRPARDPMNVPASNAAAPASLPAAPSEPAVAAQAPDVAAPQFVVAPPASPLPPPPMAPADASTATAQTIVTEPQQQEIAPLDSLRSWLHERFPQVFATP